MKICSNCKNEKPKENFHKKNNGFLNNVNFVGRILGRKFSQSQKNLYR